MSSKPLPICSVQSLNQFQHTYTLDINNEEVGNRIFEQEYFYPFEKYGLTTTFIAFNTADNTSLSILQLGVSDVVNDFHPYWNDTPTQSFMNDTLMNSRTVRVHLARTNGTQVYVMLLLLKSRIWLVYCSLEY